MSLYWRPLAHTLLLPDLGGEESRAGSVLQGLDGLCRNASQGHSNELLPQGPAWLEIALPLESFRPRVLAMCNHLSSGEFHLSCALTWY